MMVVAAHMHCELCHLHTHTCTAHCRASVTYRLVANIRMAHDDLCARIEACHNLAPHRQASSHHQLISHKQNSPP